MADWKYVMFEANGQQVPIIFPNTLIHAEVERAMGYAIREHVIRSSPGNWSSKTVSAGFVNALSVVSVHGNSESLKNLESREEDASTINLMSYENGRESVMPDLETIVLLRTIELLMDKVKSMTVNPES